MISNIPKEIRRKPSRHAYVLLGYLSATHLEHITNKSARRHALANLFHACVRHILQPLKRYGVDGKIMASADGTFRRCHPIFTCFIGDYPEQCLVTCTKSGGFPTCDVLRDELRELAHCSPCNLDAVLDAVSQVDQPSSVYTRACLQAGIKLIYHPFWEDLPYVNIFQSITSDILHQLYQGVIKHLISWLKSAFGPSEIDARCLRMPPNHSIHFFSRGISPLSRISGTKHKDICCILLGLVVDLQLPNNLSPHRLIRAVRALLDFTYLAQYPSHSTETLQYMENALHQFHNNKDILVQLGVHENFKILKLHSLWQLCEFNHAIQDTG
ncbi:hypothetical protein EW146_g9195 [Bondarzewia mesenterica]|uniref:Uncharacterized protein n=1 Tax=Bondarzewia mesenterica TaxID=1095465 RepID=A0A4S4L892_9AGAM|nr:hypothetical protein EW146_g9195 [Bondarzewia mesenterica]